MNATQRLEELLELKEELQGQLDAAKASLKVSQIGYVYHIYTSECSYNSCAYAVDAHILLV